MFKKIALAGAVALTFSSSGAIADVQTSHCWKWKDRF